MKLRIQLQSLFLIWKLLTKKYVIRVIPLKHVEKQVAARKGGVASYYKAIRTTSRESCKAAEIHVPDVKHERCMSRGFKVARFADQTYKCPPCGIAFSCSIALELHLVMSHKVTFSKDNLPELIGIIKLLSGSSSDCSKAGINLECLLCSAKCEAIDDFVLHLFSSVHIKSLRTSTCLVC